MTVKKEFMGEILHLLPEKAIYLPDKKQLLLSDLHLGKTGHFRKNGLSIPGNALIKDFQRLYELLRTYKPQSVLLLGDLFHSTHNEEWELWADVRFQFGDIMFTLIGGNHDVLHRSQYARLEMDYHNQWQEGPFFYTHEPHEEELPNETLNICGHLHPGCYVSGKGRQNATLPCFYLYNNRLVLPAFGHLTGLVAIPPKKGAHYYCIAGDSVIEY